MKEREMYAELEEIGIDLGEEESPAGDAIRDPEPVDSGDEQDEEMGVEVEGAAAGGDAEDGSIGARDGADAGGIEGDAAGDGVEGGAAPDADHAGPIVDDEPDRQ